MRKMKRIAVCAALTLLAGVLAGASCPKKDQQMTGTAGELYLEAEQLYEAADYEAAREIYQRIMEDYPLSGMADLAHFRIGQCWFKLGNNREALDEFKRYVENNRDDSRVTLAQDYVARLIERDYSQRIEERDRTIAGLELRNFRLEMLNRHLRRSVDSEVIYLELDLEADLIFVRLGTQTLYAYPMVSGKGRRKLKTTGRYKDFSTPKGVRQVEFIQRDPVWYRPNWSWLERGLEVPEDLTMEDRAVPGVLGPYKVSIGEGYYIHGTRGGKIRPGKYSHGCVRMNNKDLIQLVHLIEEGTITYIY